MKLWMVLLRLTSAKFQVLFSVSLFQCFLPLPPVHKLLLFGWYLYSFIPFTHRKDKKAP